MGWPHVPATHAQWLTVTRTDDKFNVGGQRWQLLGGGIIRIVSLQKPAGRRGRRRRAGFDEFKYHGAWSKSKRRVMGGHTTRRALAFCGRKMADGNQLPTWLCNYRDSI